MRNVYKFVDHAKDFNSLEGTKVFNAMKEANNGNLKAFKDLYIDGYSFGSDLLGHGRYKLLGWVFDFTPYCKRYLVNLKHHGWIEYKTPNKTCLYKLIGRHNVVEIIEVNN